MFHKGLNNELMLKANRELLLQLLFCLKQSSISDLAKKMELSVPAVSRLVKDLQAQGLVEQASAPVRGRGRSAGEVKIKSRIEQVICLDVRPTCVNAVLCSIFGEVLSPLASVPLTLSTPSELIKDLSLIVKDRLNGIPLAKREKTGLALAVHGQVDPKNGISLMMPQAPWHQEVHLKYYLQKETGLAIEMDNDCVMRALAQKWHLLRSLGECPDMCVINVDYGVGSSFLINNEIYRGALFGSGQIGHTIVDPQGKLCSCGRIGCLETIASKTEILNAFNAYVRAVEDRKEELSFDELAALYRAQDPRVLMTINQAALTLGRAIYNFMNIININHIYLYGCIRELGPHFLKLIRKQVMANPFDAQAQVKSLSTSIEYGTLSEAEQVAGIAYLFGEKLYRTEEEI